jgi:DNA-binding GntR family transcriptional regulator
MPQPAIPRKTLHNELVKLLRNMIMEGELVPGSRIPESRLCELFGVSRTPLRDALKVLSVEGLIYLLPNRGARVVQVTCKEMEEIVPVLGMLAALAGELACAKIKADEFASIRSMHTQLIEHYRSGIPRSPHNPKILWVDDAEIVGDGIAEVGPIAGNFFAQETERRIGELGAGCVGFVVGDVSVHEAP